MMESPKIFLPLWSAILGSILLMCMLPNPCSTEATSNVCVFGQESHCPFHCHCDAWFSDTCDTFTGHCPANMCAQFAGDSNGKYTPWFDPGCQLGNVGLEKEFSVQLSGSTIQTHAIESPYGGTVPLLCLYQNEQVQLDSLQFVLDFESNMHLHMLQVRSRYDTKVLFNAYHNGVCKLDGFITDDISNKSNETHCSSRYPSYDESVMFICNKKGRYFILSSSGCNLGDLNLTNLCIEAVEAFGFPAVDIECSRCTENNNSMLTTNVKTYLSQMNAILEKSVEANNTMDLLSFENNNCGNGIWCEACDLGWMPPDCQNPCPYGTFGFNCAHLCSHQIVPDQYHCKDKQTHACDPVSGDFIQCSEGCDLWYAGGELCTEYVQYFDYEAGLSNITVGSDYISFWFSSEERISRNLSQFYVYQVEYASADREDYMLYPFVIAHTSDQVSYLANITNLPAGQNINIRVRLGRRQGDITEMFPTNVTRSFTSWCVDKPDVRTDSFSLYVWWNSSIMHPQCGDIQITGLYVWAESTSRLMSYNIADGTEIRVPNLDKGVYVIYLDGYSSDGYRVIGDYILAEVKDIPDVEEPTTEGTEEGESNAAQTDWDLNKLAIILLLVVIIVCVVIVVVIIVLCVLYRRKPSSKEKPENRPPSNLTIRHSAEGVRRYVRDPSVNHSSHSTTFDNDFEMEHEFQSGKRQRKDTDHGNHKKNRPITTISQDPEPFYHQIAEMNKMKLGEDNGGYVQAVGDSFKSDKSNGNRGQMRTPSVDAPIPNFLGSNSDSVKSGNSASSSVDDRPAPKIPDRNEKEEDKVSYYGRNGSNKSDQQVFL